MPGVAHAYAGLGAHQLDLAGVHASQCSHINCHFRLGAAVVCKRSSLGVSCIHLIAPGGDFQVAGPHPGVYLDGACNQVGVVTVTGIQALARDAQGAAFNAVAGDLAILQLSTPGGQRGAVGVNEAAAVTGNTRRVGDHNLGALAGHFDIAAQLARVAGVDFVQNDTRTAIAQVRVTFDPTAQLRLAIAPGVVEDGTSAIDVELVVGVVRNTCCTGRLDVDQRCAVGAFHHHRPLAAWSRWVGNNARSPGRRSTQAYQAQGAHHGKAQAAQGCDALSGTVSWRLRVARRLALRADIFGHHHEQAARLVENDPVKVLVHCNSLCACRSASGDDGVGGKPGTGLFGDHADAMKCLDLQATLFALVVERAGTAVGEHAA